MASSADDKNRLVRDLIRTIEKRLECRKREDDRRKREDMIIIQDLNLLKELAIPQGESKTVEATEWGVCPDCKNPGGKLQISKESIFHIDFL